MSIGKKGHGFERAMVEKLSAIWPECYTSRYKGSLCLGYSGVDLTGTALFNFQLKAQGRVIPYHTILGGMPKGNNTNVILHKRTNKGVVAVVEIEDFLKIASTLKNCGNEE